MEFNEQFQSIVSAWEKHCDDVSMRSSLADYEDPTAIEEIIRMGREATPLIKAYLQANPDSVILPHLWLTVVENITGEEIAIPKNIEGIMKAIRAHLINTLS